MGHPNDTLNGKLFAYEREDEKHLRHSFGYWRMVERRMIREELAKEGITPEDFGYWQREANAIIENHKNDPIGFRQVKIITAAKKAPIFTQEELEEIIFLTEHSNSEIGQAIYKKVFEYLKE